MLKICDKNTLKYENYSIISCRFSKVYDGLTYEQEAELCYKLDKAKKRLSLSQSTNVLAESGGDAQISEIQCLVGKAGFVWALNKKKEKQGRS